MNQKYNDCGEKVSQILFEAIAKREEKLSEKILSIDTDLLSLLRAIGLKVMSMLLTMLITQVTTQAKKTGGIIHRRPLIKYTTIFGQLKIESPYIWNKELLSRKNSEHLWLEWISIRK
jgi:hypothetical protein